MYFSQIGFVHPLSPTYSPSNLLLLISTSHSIKIILAKVTWKLLGQVFDPDLLAELSPPSASMRPHRPGPAFSLSGQLLVLSAPSTFFYNIPETLSLDSALLLLPRSLDGLTWS